MPHPDVECPGTIPWGMLWLAAPRGLALMSLDVPLALSDTSWAHSPLRSRCAHGNSWMEIAGMLLQCCVLPSNGSPALPFLLPGASGSVHPHRCKSAEKTVWEHLARGECWSTGYRAASCFSWWSLFLSLVQALDGNIYDHLKDYLMAFSRTELETCQAVQNTFQFLLETSSRVSLNWMILCNSILAAWMNPQAWDLLPKSWQNSRVVVFCYSWLVLS